MKRLKAFAAVFALSITFILALAACGTTGPTNLEEFVAANPEVAEDMIISLEQSGDENVDVTVDFKGNNCILTSKYKNTFDEDQVKVLSEALEVSADQMIDICNTCIVDMEDVTEFEGITMTLKYVNGDGSKIWAKTYEREKK